MMGIEKDEANCDVLSSCQFEKIETKDLSAFLLNPMRRSGYFNGMIFQKYEVDIYVDELFYMKDGKFKGFAFSNYQTKKIYTQKIFDELELEGVDDSFLSIQSVAQNATRVVSDRINKAKVDRINDIKDTSTYDSLSKQYAFVYPQIVFLKILGKEVEDFTRNIVEVNAMNFVKSLKFRELLRVIDGNYPKIEQFIEEFIFTKAFIEREVVIEEFKESAYAYFEAGYFNKRELLFKKFVEKVKASRSKIFKATLMDGSIVKLKNEIVPNGIVKVLKDGRDDVDFEKIKTLEVDRKIIYDKYID